MNSFLKNFFSLSIFQGINYLIPLIIVPYIIKHVGIEKYGLLTFAQSIAGFLNVFFDFGFNLIGVDKIAKNSLVNKKNEIFNAIYFIKIFIFLIVFFIFIILVFNFSKLEENYITFFLFLFVSFFQSLFPIWFFQGIEKMKYILYFNIIGKLITFLIIILFLKKETDYNIYPLAFLIGYIVSDVIALIFIFKNFHFKIYIPSMKRLKVIFKTSFKIFSNNLIVKTYSNLNIIILGFFTNNLIVGYYSIGIKLSGVFSAFLGVFLQTIYPKFSKIARNNFCEYIKIFNKTLIGVLLSSCLIMIVYLFFEKDILKFLVNDINNDLVNIVFLCAFLIIFSPVGNTFTNFFVISHKYNLFFKVALWTAIFNFTIFIILLNINKLYSLAFAIIITQLIHFFLNLYFYIKVKNNKCVDL